MLSSKTDYSIIEILKKTNFATGKLYYLTQVQNDTVKYILKILFFI